MVGICSTVGKQAKRMPDTIVKTTTTNSIYCNYCLTWLMSPLKHGKIFKKHVFIVYNKSKNVD